ncbi:dihydroorotate dehydrogenase (quinone), partial [Winogradskyella sp. ZXX205]|nr:dihydroorotate dehydrogenase (quinone) [Winogradskyella ouciana]
TGMIYQGPGISKQINKQLLKLMQRDGFSHISEAVGVDAKA